MSKSLARSPTRTSSTPGESFPAVEAIGDRNERCPRGAGLDGRDELLTRSTVAGAVARMPELRLRQGLLIEQAVADQTAQTIADPGLDAYERRASG
jgi:hypothetical protein